MIASDPKQAQILSDLLAYIKKKRLNHQSLLFHVNKWLYRRFRREFKSVPEAVDFLFTRYQGQYRYLWLFDSKFLRLLWGRSVQEYRPNRYPSRYFGVGYMNVQKVLRRKNREMIERWVYHEAIMRKFVDMFEYLEKYLKNERLIEAIDRGFPTAELEKLYLDVYDKFNFPAPDEVALSSNTILIKKENGTKELAAGTSQAFA